MAIQPTIFYCNGICNTWESANQTKDYLAARIKAPVELHFNDSTPSDKFGTAIVCGALGVVGTAVSGFFLAKTWKEKNIVGTLAAGTGLTASVVLLIISLCIFKEIQERKEQLAEELKDKMIKQLDAKPNSRVLLILHSQGAEIGDNARKKMPLNYRNRIDVITLGGKNHILPEDEGRVSNLTYKADWVPYIFGDQTLPENAKQAKYCLFDRTVQVCTELYGEDAKVFEIFENNACKTTMCHGSEDYIRQNRTIEIIFDFMEPPLTAPVG